MIYDKNSKNINFLIGKKLIFYSNSNGYNVKSNVYTGILKEIHYDRFFKFEIDLSSMEVKKERCNFCAYAEMGSLFEFVKELNEIDDNKNYLLNFS